MSGYLLSVIGTVLLCALLTAIAPDGKTSATVKGVARLACVLTIVAPVLEFFRSGSLNGLLGENGENFFSQTGIEGDSSFIQYYSELRINETENALEQELFDTYSVTVEVQLDWRMETETVAALYQVERVRIERIRIKLAEEIPKEVEENLKLYVKENYCSEVLLE